MHVSFWSATAPFEVMAALTAFVLCSLIGIERQFRQKSAGYRVHVLVGLGSCVFTLISALGFAFVFGNEFGHATQLDPSRIAAQIVTGIGFLGAGVIFKGRNFVRGLTTAATIWVAAAVGMACGAGMFLLATLLTLLHLLTLFVIGPLVRRIPTVDHNRVLDIMYADGEGRLRALLAVATQMGFNSSILSSDRTTLDGQPFVTVRVRFNGRSPLDQLVSPLADLDGVESVHIVHTTTDRDDE